MTIFGISIGTTKTGVCVLQDGVLIDRQLHKFTSALSEKKLRLIVKRYRHYLQRYSIDAVVVKIPPLHKHSKAVKLLLKKIEALAKEYYCEFDLFTKGELKSNTNTHSMDELIEYAQRLYPDLNIFNQKGDVVRRGYYKKMYEAILAAHIYQERQIIRALQIERIN